MAKRDLEHLLGRGHLQVQRDGEVRHQLGDILVAYVAPILAEMGGDAVGAGRGGGEGGADRIGMIAAARVPDRRDMVDIDPQAEMTAQGVQAPSASLGTGALRLPGFSAGIAASSGGSASAA